MKCSNRQRSQYKFYYPHNIVITGKTAFPVNTCFMAMDGDEPHCLPIHSLMLIFDQQFHCRPIFSTCPVPTTDPPLPHVWKTFCLNSNQTINALPCLGKKECIWFSCKFFQTRTKSNQIQALLWFPIQIQKSIFKHTYKLGPNLTWPYTVADICVQNVFVH